MTDLLEDAIRAGIERGMDEAPVGARSWRSAYVPCLCVPRPRWPLVAAAAAVAGFVLAGRLWRAPADERPRARLPNASSSSAAVQSCARPLAFHRRAPDRSP